LACFGVGWSLEGSLAKTVVNEVYRVIVKNKNKIKKNKQTKNPNTQKNGESQEAKIGLQKPDFVVYLNSGSNLLGGLRRNQSFSLDG
jgi:trafficking kinesin-binding protein 2